MKRLQAQGYLLQHLVQLETPVAPPQAPAVKPTSAPTRPWEDSVLSHRSLGLFFDQLYAFLKAGYTVAEALRLLADRVVDRRLSESCRQMAEGAARGERLSSLMERYPTLFPEYVVGNIRAGEVAGYLPEAAFEIARICEGWHRVKLWYWIPRTCLFNALITAPIWALLPVLFLQGLSYYADHPHVGVYGALVHVGSGLFFKWVLPLWGGVLFAWAVWRWLLAPHLERQRSKAALGMPIIFGYGRWVLTNSLQLFLKNLGRLYTAGLSPATTWEMAVHTVPNRAIAERLRLIQLQVGERMLNLDAAIEQSGLFPPEQVALLRTAVQTGDVTGTLERLTSLYEEEAKHQATRTRLGLLRLAFLIFLLGFGIGCIGCTHNYYGRIFQWVETFIGSP